MSRKVITLENIDFSYFPQSRELDIYSNVGYQNRSLDTSLSKSEVKQLIEFLQEYLESVEE